MTDRPIIFSAPMIQALLAGRKTMTRRLAWRLKDVNDNHTRLPTPWQRVKPGDRMWVRENFHNQQMSRYRGWKGDRPADRLSVCIDYASDGKRCFFDFVDRIDHESQGLPKILTKRGRGESGKETVILPCIHMPRAISRLTLIVTATKIERLQKISNADAIAEGCGVNFDHEHPELTRETFPAERFRCLWNALHGPESWDANPELVVVTFTVHKQTIDSMKVSA